MNKKPSDNQPIVQMSDPTVNEDAFFEKIKSEDFRSIVNEFNEAMEPVTYGGTKWGRPRAHAPASLAAMHVLLDAGLSERLAEKKFSDESFWGRVLSLLVSEFPDQFVSSGKAAPNRSAYKRMKGRLSSRTRSRTVAPRSILPGNEVTKQVVFDFRKTAKSELFFNLSEHEDSSESLVVTATRKGLRMEFYDEQGRKFVEVFGDYSEWADVAAGGLSS